MDFINDHSGRHILRLSTVLDAPPYVKEASVVVDDIAPLPNGAFAVSHKREFPIDTPGHVWLSYGYCKSAGVTDARLLGKLTQAGELFGISDDLKAIDAAFTNLTKKAAHARAFAVMIDFGTPDPESDNSMRKSGGIHGFYPVGDQFEVESSAVKLANDQQRIPLEVFAEGCRNLVKAAREQNVTMSFLPQRILDYGIERIAAPEIVRHAAAMRKQATGDDIYEQIAESAVQNNDGIASHEYAELWLNADRQNEYKKARHEPDAYILFNSGPTEAEIERQIESWVDIAGAPVPVTKVAAVREDTVRKWFPKEAAEKFIALIKRAASASGSELTAGFSELDAALQTAFVKRLLLS